MPRTDVLIEFQHLNRSESGGGAPDCPVAAIGDHRGTADGVLGSGQFPRLAVVAVTGHWPTDGDDQPSVGVDDDLVVDQVPVVFGLFGDHVVAVGDVSAVYGQHGVAAEPLGVVFKCHAHIRSDARVTAAW